jgi:mannose-6-phosphate isomerase class I
MQIQEDSCISSDEEETHEWFLGDIIEQDPTFWLGKEEARRRNIPFLLKVLSVRQALSIQAHPNKKLAEELHRTCPGHYPDGNHKPEICIPLGHFEALCGFRPVGDVRRHVSEVPELRRLVQLDEEEVTSASLQDMFSRLMKADSVQQTNQVVALVNRLKDIVDPDRDQKLILRISQDYPMDVGIFSVYFLNYVVITEDMPNRFIYCAPDEPHAYLCGDAVECMAMSDNVVRAGLTQKFKDVDTLLRMMTWRDDLLDELVNVGERVQAHVVKYNPPVEDFMLYEVDGPVPDGIVLTRASIVACISGRFVVDFRSLVANDRGDSDGKTAEIFAGADVPFSWRGEKKIIKGNTFFSRAGTELIVKSARENSRLFIATY